MIKITHKDVGKTFVETDIRKNEYRILSVSISRGTCRIESTRHGFTTTAPTTMQHMEWVHPEISVDKEYEALLI